MLPALTYWIDLMSEIIDERNIFHRLSGFQTAISYAHRTIIIENVTVMGFSVERIKWKAKGSKENIEVKAFCRGQRIDCGAIMAYGRCEDKNKKFYMYLITKL
jgi:hypothetical protein